MEQSGTLPVVELRGNLASDTSAVAERKDPLPSRGSHARRRQDTFPGGIQCANADLFGSEGYGILWGMAACDEPVAIPMSRQVDSLKTWGARARLSL